MHRKTRYQSPETETTADEDVHGDTNLKDTGVAVASDANVSHTKIFIYKAGPFKTRLSLFSG